MNLNYIWTKSKLDCSRPSVCIFFKILSNLCLIHCVYPWCRPVPDLCLHASQTNQQWTQWWWCLWLLFFVKIDSLIYFWHKGFLLFKNALTFLEWKGLLKIAIGHKMIPLPPRVATNSEYGPNNKYIRFWKFNEYRTFLFWK